MMTHMLYSFTAYLFQKAKAFCILSLCGFPGVIVTTGFVRCDTCGTFVGDFDSAASFSNNLAVRLTFPVGTNLLRILPISSLGSSISSGTKNISIHKCYSKIIYLKIPVTR